MSLGVEMGWFRGSEKPRATKVEIFVFAHFSLKTYKMLNLLINSCCMANLGKNVIVVFLIHCVFFIFVAIKVLISSF